ncbi:hypothetical protein QBC33DRAFT_573950 [Phialemonium atrogriseum]|uniref:Uncharacterized protein n=1 Tax=Phialemonium atrogriseum TaxID=1093897 RepID=A0AAJ0BT18_9PEZI|nr:uncharacterized protein QBC33DRAFT_573950 [Phialemonium atrogriseum]KAK1762873.1 hypothetical protein QBC33DRAFT_573950 [Phialemonium atrogriseum]
MPFEYSGSNKPPLPPPGTTQPIAITSSSSPGVHRDAVPPVNPSSRGVTGQPSTAESTSFGYSRDPGAKAGQFTGAAGSSTSTQPSEAKAPLFAYNRGPGTTTTQQPVPKAR